MDAYYSSMFSNTETIRILKPEIFSFSECLCFLDRGYDDCLYSIDGTSVQKPLRVEGNKALIRVEEDDKSLKVEMLSGDDITEDALKEVADYVSAWFDLQRDLRPFYQLLKESDRFSWMSDRFAGLRLMGIPDLFEALCWCVTGQQINLTFAYRLKRKLVETYGTSIIYNSSRYFYFPEPEVLAGLEINDLKELQFSRQKAEYIIGIAKEFSEGNLAKNDLANFDTSKQMLARLKEIKGVGDWTANYVLMKSLQQLNCITYGDTGLQSAISSILDMDRKPTRQEIEAVFEPFAGWESYLNIYLWRTLS